MKTQRAWAVQNEYDRNELMLDGYGYPVLNADGRVPVLILIGADSIAEFERMRERIEAIEKASEVLTSPDIDNLRSLKIDSAIGKDGE